MKKKLKRLKPFERWNYEEVEQTFGVKRVLRLPALDTWLSSKEPLTPAEEAILAERRDFTLLHVPEWKEDDLKAQLIIPVLNLVNFYTDRYRIFYSPYVTLQLDDDTAIAGFMDCVVAQGKLEPRHPYLFIHEYKKEKGTDSDPLGQLLIALVATQHTDPVLTPDEPRLGLYILGRLWFFAVLQGKEYAVSAAYDASQDDIFQIARILRFAKARVEAQFEAA